MNAGFDRVIEQDSSCMSALDSRMQLSLFNFKNSAWSKLQGRDATTDPLQYQGLSLHRLQFLRHRSRISRGTKARDDQS